MIRYFSDRYKHSRVFPNFKEDLTLKMYYYENTKEVVLWQYITVAFKGRGENISACHKFKVITDRALINSVFKGLRRKFRYQHEWDELRKDILHQIFTPREKHWQDVLPESICRWANSTLERLSSDESCCDNFRVALVGNTCQEKRYRRQLKRGCCGFFDETFKCPIDNKLYRLGFNYGH